MIRHILHFDKSDWKHIGWLFKCALKGLWTGDWERIESAVYWILFHIKYDSKKIG